MAAVNGVPSAVGYSASDSATANVQSESEEAVIKGRMDLARDVNQCLEGDVYPFVDFALRSAYDDKQYLKMKVQSGISTRLSPMKRGVAKADKSWAGGEAGQPGADYALEGAPDDGGDVFKEHMRRSKIDEATRECSRRMWVHPGFVAGPIVVGDRFARDPRQFVTRLFTPDRFNAIPYPKAPGHLWKLQIFSHDPTSKFPFERLDWTVETWERWQRRSNEEKWNLVEAGQNPYGRIPYTLARPNPFSLWADNFGPELLESTIRINAAQTLLTYNSHSQVKALFGPFQKILTPQRLYQGALIDNGGESGTLVDFQTDQAAFREVHVNGEWKMAAELLGFPADEFDGTAVPQSGEALKMRLYAALQNAMARQVWLKAFAEDLYWCQLQILATEMLYPAPIVGYEKRQLPPYATGVTVEQQPVRFCVKLKPITLPQLAAEVAAADDRDMALGFKSQAELMIRINPGMSEDEAIEKIKENKAINAELRAAGSSSAATSGAVATDVMAEEGGKKKPGWIEGDVHPSTETPAEEAADAKAS